MLFRDICPGVGQLLLGRALPTPLSLLWGGACWAVGRAVEGQGPQPSMLSQLSQGEVGRAEGSCHPTRWGTGVAVSTADVPRRGSGPVTAGEARVQGWAALQAALWVGQTPEKVLGGDL